MATLDYNAISSRWKSTMPNRAILKDLISQTRGRLIIMNDSDLYMDFNEEDLLSHKIEDAKTKLSATESTKFFEDYTVQDYSKQYTIEIEK